MTSQNITFSKLKTNEESLKSASIFVNSEPWLTLKMGNDYFLSLFKNPVNETFILKKEEEIVGVVVLQLQGPFPGYIKSIVIADEWQGKGYGKVLLNHTEERIFKDFPNVFLCVSTFNTNAHKFYIKQGYKDIGTLENYVINGEDEILMRKTSGPLYSCSGT